MKRLSMLMVIAIALCGATPAPPLISATVTNWRQIVDEWRIKPDGSIRLTRSNSASPGSPASLKITRETASSAARYRRIANLLAPFRDPSMLHRTCAQPLVNDQNEIALQWGQGTPLAFYEGCNDRWASVLRARFHQADAQIVAWAKGAPVVERRPVKF